MIYSAVWWHTILLKLSILQWRHNGRDGVSNYQPLDCLLNRSFRRRSTKASKLRVIGICKGNSPVTGEFPAQMASNAEMFPFDDVIISFDQVIKYLMHCVLQVAWKSGVSGIQLYGRSPWRLLLGLLSRYPIFKSNHCNSFEDRVLWMPGVQMCCRQSTSWQVTGLTVPAMTTG